jgi:cysteinyl-tRNA synthetase
MSKSLGNFFTIREIFEKSKWPEAETGEMLRYFLLGTHYRSPLDFSDKSIEEAKNALNGFYDLFKRLKESEERATADEALMAVIERCRVAFCEAMDDDFNTPVALAALQGLRSGVNKLLDKGLSNDARKTAREKFRSLGNVLGLFQTEQWQFGQMPFRSALATDMSPPIPRSMGWEMSQIVQSGTPLPLMVQSLADAEIQLRVDERNEARKQKDFKKADEIRQFLASCGIVIEDKPDGTSRWKR